MILNTGGLNLGMALAEAVEIRTIAQLPEVVRGLSGYEGELFNGADKLIEVNTSIGELDPDHLLLNGLERQILVEPYNPWNHRRVVFNPERAKRLSQPGDLSQIKAEISQTLHNNQFCNYQEETPKNRFNGHGRIEGRVSRTTASLYMSAQTHGILIFEHDPLLYPPIEAFLDRYAVADQWHEAAQDKSPDSIYHSIIENKLKKAGGTVLHGHAQLAGRPNRHEGDMEEALDNAIWYHYKTGRDYFDDLFRAHQLVGLGVERASIRVFPSLTPKKEAEVDILADRFDTSTRKLLYRIYGYFMNNVSPAFNLTIGFRPTSYDGRNWGMVPGIIITLISRGNPTQENSDIGGFELMGTSIVSTDPYIINEGLKQALNT